MSLLIPHDELAARDVIMFFASADGAAPVNRLVDFQYPPRVKADSRLGEWTATASKGGKSNSPALEEPVFTYQGGNPRKLQLEWDYVVDEENWTIAKIRDNLLRLRSYAANIGAVNNLPIGAAGNQFQDQLVIKFKCYAIGGESLMSYRSEGVSITYDDTLITIGDITFPQKSTVSMSLMSWPEVNEIVMAAGQVVTFTDWY